MSLSKYTLPAVFTLMLSLASLSFTTHMSHAAPSDPAPQPKQCKEGYVYSDALKKCVKKTSEVLTDQDLYVAAVGHINSGNYETSLDLLWRIKYQSQPKVLNYIGFATRKLGRIEEGIAYYKQALKIDADFVQARQYLGEGYLQKGLVEKAKEELSEIANRCGTSCDHYKTLSQQIASYEKSRAKES